MEARDGRHVLELMTQHPDLIIVDLVLADIDRFNLTQKIRSLSGGPDIPIIAYTGVMTRLEEARSVKVGFTDYLFKPITPSRLLETIETYLPPKGSPGRVGTGERLREVGANDLVLKDPGFTSVVAAVSSTLGSTPPPATRISRGLGEDYTRRLAQQRDRQMMLNTSIHRRLMQREAELAVLSTFLDALLAWLGGGNS